MTWGFFSITHILTLILAILLNIGLYFLIKKFNQKKQIIILFIMSLLGIAAIIFNLIAWDSPLEYLPLHLCSLTALILPFCVIKRSNVLANLLILWGLGAFVALILNTSVSEANVFSLTFFFYYFPHVFECGIPLIMLKLKLVKLDKKYLLSTILITFAVYTLIHFVNVGINSYCISNNILNSNGEIIKVNYMFSIYPENPLLNIFYKIIPHSYFYMLLCFPIIAIYLILIYLIVKRKNIKKMI